MALPRPRCSQWQGKVCADYGEVKGRGLLFVANLVVESSLRMAKGLQLIALKRFWPH